MQKPVYSKTWVQLECNTNQMGIRSLAPPHPPTSSGRAGSIHGRRSGPEHERSRDWQSVHPARGRRPTALWGVCARFWSFVMWGASGLFFDQEGVFY